jgi:iron complex outermembrane receptor protein
LTLAEFQADPGVAAPNSLNRNAGKQLDQQQLSLGLSHHAGGLVIDGTAWSIWRDLDNPLAAPAPPPTTATEGVWIGIDRQVVGARTTVQAPLGLRTVASAGLDLQRMTDDRVNRRHDAGVVAGPAFLDQRERVAEFGGFAQMLVFAGRGWSLRAGGRHDRVTFEVDDHLEPAAGGERTMAAWSGGGAIAWRSDHVELWWGIGTAFETPTTTELANRPDGSTGLNRDLDPARTMSIESGIRLLVGGVAIEAVGFAGRTTDAITPIAESGGRSFFANVGETSTRGVEASLAVRPADHVRVHATLTVLRSRFGDGATSATGTAITDNTLPGVVPFSARLGATFARGPVVLDLDQAWASAVWADDANTIEVPGWGAGVTSAMLRVQTALGSTPLALRLGVRNLFDRAHAAGVVVNGGFGRVVEPGNGRRIVVGVEIGRRY